MTIGELAEKAGVATSAIRYYEEVGLLPRAARVSGRREFREETFNRLMVIQFAKEAGFSLREIRQLLTGFTTGTPASARWHKVATEKLAEIEALTKRLALMRRLLEEALRCGCIELETCAKLFRAHRSSRRFDRS